MGEMDETVGMNTDFQILPLSREAFEPFFALAAQELSQAEIVAEIVDSVPGYPCRISLQDLPVGEEVLLVNYCHQLAQTPYRSNGPIFIGRNSQPAKLEVNEVPKFLLGRPLSVRAYGADHMMVEADVISGEAVADKLREFFGNPQVAYQHVHFAKRGCFACVAERAEERG